jgi:outer membrane protein
MNRTPRTRILAALVALVAAGVPATARGQGAAGLETLIRAAADRYAGAAGALPGGAQPAGPTRALTLEEAMAVALRNNLDIAVLRANPAAYDVELAGLRSAYHPAITSLLANGGQVTPPITLLTGGERVTTTTTTVNGALSQNVPWQGGALGLSWNNERVGTNSIFYNYNPAFNTTVAAQYTQPLLRGRRTDALREQIVVTKINREISDLQLQATIANTAAGVQDAYWDLVFAADSITVARASVDLARRLVEENQDRVRFGTMTRLDLVTAQAQEAAARHTLVVAEGNRRTAELALKRLLVSGPADPLWQSGIEPTDRPADVLQPIDLEQAIRGALAGRTDLAAARRQLAANQAALAFLQDQARPQADLVGSYSLNGLGGPLLLRQGTNPFTALTGPVIGTIPGGYGTALGSLGRYPSWGVSLNVTYPIGNSTARAEAARAKVQLSQADLEIRQIEVQVVADVTDAAIAVRSDFDAVQSATVARDLAAQRLEAEQRKYAAGVSTNYFVVQAQKDLADAQNQELQAEVGYRKALVAFDRAQHTTLQASGITIVTPGALVAPGTGSGRPAAPAPSAAIFQP